jgi:PPM family protein phosphatase
VTISWRAAGGTDVGRVRERNEDAFRADPELGILLVADGMGGHAAGEVASTVAADAAMAVLRGGVDESGPEGHRAAMGDAFLEAHRQIAARSAESPETRGMGTTLTAVVLQRTGAMQVGHIGDSRLYRLREGALAQVTRDHTWVQAEIDAGRLDAGALRTHPLSHILTRVLAADEASPPDLVEDLLVPGDVLLLCSDGLHNMVDDVAIAGFLSVPEDPPQSIVEKLIHAANEAGGVDNVTAVVVRVEAAG